MILSMVKLDYTSLHNHLLYLVRRKLTGVRFLVLLFLFSLLFLIHLHLLLLLYHLFLSCQHTWTVTLSPARYDDDFNILSWWQEHQLTFLVLSILARDVMSILVSTVSSESCFSLTGRVIEERRRRLTPEMVEMLTCIKD